MILLWAPYRAGPAEGPKARFCSDPYDSTRSRSPFSSMLQPYIPSEPSPAMALVPSSPAQPSPISSPVRTPVQVYTVWSTYRTVMPCSIPAAEWPVAWLIPMLGPEAPDFLKDVANGPDPWMRHELPMALMQGARFQPCFPSPRPGGRWRRSEVDGGWWFSPGVYVGGNFYIAKPVNAAWVSPTVSP